MSTTYEFPVTPANQSFTMPMNGVNYNFNLYWNNQAGVWYLDIADELSNPLVSSIPLVTGIDLLNPYTYLNFGVQLIAFTDFDASQPPTYENLGTTGHLQFIVQ